MATATSHSQPILSSYDRFFLLAKLLARKQPILRDLRPAFQVSAERLASEYWTKTDDHTLLEFLALPKLGLIPAFRTRQGGQYLAFYPDLSWPASTGIGPRDQQSHRIVKRMVEEGKLGAHARVLTGDYQAAELDEGTMEQLKMLHPE